MADEKPMIAAIGEDEPESDCACASPDMCWINRLNPGEQDCACPDSGSPIMRDVDAGLWQCPPDLYRAPLPRGHEIAFAPGPSAGAAVLNAPARRILAAFAGPRRLADGPAAVPDLDAATVVGLARQMAEQGLIRREGEPEAGCRAAPHTLTAWLHITSRCNLRCVYCYAARADEDMDASTGRAAVESVFRAAARHGFRTVKLKYAGGEPSLRTDVVLAVHEHAQGLAAAQGLALRGVLLSNGVGLVADRLRTVRDAGLQLALSLDGIGRAHEAQRGAGTYRATADAIDQAIALGLRPFISVTVTAGNAAGLRDVVAYLLDRDLPICLNFYRDHAAVRGESLRAGDGRLIEGVRAALAVIEERLPRYSLAGGLLDRTHLGYPHGTPCAVGESYLAIDPAGRVARCHMELDRAAGSVWDADPLAAVRDAPVAWHNHHVDLRSGCRNCTWRYWCAGGCPLLTYRVNGRDDGPSPYCYVYRTLLPEVLRLEGLRTLKWDRPVA